MNKELEPYKRLRLSEILSWAGMKGASRGRSYQQEGRVENLVRTDDGSLIAWVRGSRKYATRVKLSRGKLDSICDCSTMKNCKHAVALLYHFRNSRDIEIPLIDKKDKRLKIIRTAETSAKDMIHNSPPESGLLQNEDLPIFNPDKSDTIPGEQNDFLSSMMFSSDTGAPAEFAQFLFDPAKARIDGKDLRDYLYSLTKEQLIDIIEEFMFFTPPAHKGPVTGETGKTGADVILDSIRGELDMVNDFASLENNVEIDVPDFIFIREQLSRLMESDNPDAIFEITEEIMEKGMLLLDMVEDTEGELEKEISECINIAIEALPHSTMPAVGKVLWIIGLEIMDDYGIIYPLAEKVYKLLQLTSQEWTILGDCLQNWLNEPIRNANYFHGDFSRNIIISWIIRSLENSGQENRIEPFCDEEEEYSHLIRYLLKNGKRASAEEWAEKACRRLEKKRPDEAMAIRDMFSDNPDVKIQDRLAFSSNIEEVHKENVFNLRKSPADIKNILASFLENPNMREYVTTREIAFNMGIWNSIYPRLIDFLETGIFSQEKTGSAENAKSRQGDFPMNQLLLETAIFENQPDSVIKYYNRIFPEETCEDPDWKINLHLHKYVAVLLENTEPIRAVELMKRIVDAEIAGRNQKSYNEAINFVGEIGRILINLKQKKEWEEYKQLLIDRNRRKRNLKEMIQEINPGERA